MSMSQRSGAAYTIRQPYDSTPFLSHAQSVSGRMLLMMSGKCRQSPFTLSAKASFRSSSRSMDVSGP